MDPISSFLVGQGLDYFAEESGLKKRAKGILSELADAIIPPAAASGADAIDTSRQDQLDALIAKENQMQQPVSDAQMQMMNQVTAQSPSMQGFAQQASIPSAEQRKNEVQDFVRMVGGRTQNLMQETPEGNPQEAAALATTEAMAAKGVSEDDNGFFDQVGGFLTDLFGDEERMTRMALAFNSMRLQPDQGLATVLGKRLETLGTQRKDNATIAMLLKDGSPEAIRAANYIRMGGDAKTALKNFRKAGTVKVMTGAQLKSEYGIETPDPTALYNYDTVTGKLSGVGGPSKTILQMGNEALTGAIYRDIGDQRTAFIEEGKSSRGRLDAYNRIGNLLRTTDQGRFAETKQDVRKILDTIGLGDAIDVDQYQNATSLQAATNQLVAEELRANKGPQTDFDARFSQSYIPNIQNPAEANKAMVKFGQSKAEGQTVFGRIANKIRSTDPDVENKMAALNEMALTFNNVIFAPNGTPLYFIDWANANRGEDPVTIMSQWVEKVKQNQMGQ
jgi:hypothetical protein